MHIISRGMLRDYWERGPDTAFAEKPLSAWFKLVKAARWKSPDELKATLGHASIRPKGRVVFNVAGNKLRIVAGINFAVGVVYIKFVGSHEEYDAVDVDTVEPATRRQGE